MAADERSQTLQREVEARFTAQQRATGQVRCCEACRASESIRPCSVAAAQHEVCDLPHLQHCSNVAPCRKEKRDGTPELRSDS